MSTHQNSRYINHFGTENSSPLRPTFLACRICDQIFINALSLLEHYDSHENELPQRNQNNQTTTYLSSLRASRERNLTNNSIQPRLSSPSTLHQRHHPYFPHNHRALQRERVATPQTNPYRASTQTANYIEPTHPVANNNSLGASFQITNRISGRNVSNGGPFVIHHRLSSAQRVVVPNFQEQIGQNEFAKNGTVWYLSQLEKPIPKLIDLEKENGWCEFAKLDLTLKL